MVRRVDNVRSKRRTRRSFHKQKRTMRSITKSRKMTNKRKRKNNSKRRTNKRTNRKINRKRTKRINRKLGGSPGGTQRVPRWHPRRSSKRAHNLELDKDEMREILERSLAENPNDRKFFLDAMVTREMSDAPDPRTKNTMGLGYDSLKHEAEVEAHKKMVEMMKGAQAQVISDFHTENSTNQQKTVCALIKWLCENGIHTTEGVFREQGATDRINRTLSEYKTLRSNQNDSDDPGQLLIECMVQEGCDVIDAGVILKRWYRDHVKFAEKDLDFIERTERNDKITSDDIIRFISQLDDTLRNNFILVLSLLQSIDPAIIYPATESQIRAGTMEAIVISFPLTDRSSMSADPYDRKFFECMISSVHDSTFLDSSLSEHNPNPELNIFAIIEMLGLNHVFEDASLLHYLIPKEKANRPKNAILISPTLSLSPTTSESESSRKTDVLSNPATVPSSPITSDKQSLDADIASLDADIASLDTKIENLRKELKSEDKTKEEVRKIERQLGRKLTLRRRKKAFKQAKVESAESAKTEAQAVAKVSIQTKSQSDIVQRKVQKWMEIVSFKAGQGEAFLNTDDHTSNIRDALVLYFCENPTNDIDDVLLKYLDKESFFRAFLKEQLIKYQMQIEGRTVKALSTSFIVEDPNILFLEYEKPTAI